MARAKEAMQACVMTRLAGQGVLIGQCGSASSARLGRGTHDRSKPSPCNSRHQLKGPNTDNGATYAYAKGRWCDKNNGHMLGFTSSLSVPRTKP